MSDPVNNPPHYNQGEVETIDGIRAALGGGFVDYCRGNVLKYVWRCGKKGDSLEDLRKAAKYLEWAIEAIEAEKKPETLAIPEGWRELEENEPLCEGDLFDFDGKWVGHEYDPAGGVYSSRIHRRHIRKIETEKYSETPNSSTWIPKVGDTVIRPCGRPAKVISIDSLGGQLVYGCKGTSSRFTLGTLKPWIPKVGDKVRVIRNHHRLHREACIVSEVYDQTLVSVVSDHDGDMGWMRLDQLELIEAAE